jgi:hypothetical protein
MHEQNGDISPSPDVIPAKAGIHAFHSSIPDAPCNNLNLPLQHFHRTTFKTKSETP